MAFVDNTTLIEELLASHEIGKLTPKAHNLFIQISKQRVNKMLKTNKALHEDIILSLCVDKLIKIWHSYKFDQDNCFAYMVSVVDNTIKRYFIDNAAGMNMISLDGSSKPTDSAE